MEFKKYNSIENSYREKFLDYMKRELLHGGEFVVHEKVHGANFSFWFDGEVFRCAKRSGFLSGKEEQNFGGAATVLKEHIDRLKTLYTNLQFKFPGFKIMTVYGEIIGGSYPHEAVPETPHAARVQKGVFYCPHNDFYAFDIVLDGDYLTEDQTSLAFETCGFLYAKQLFRGSLEDCMAYPNKFQSYVPGWLGLPPIEENTCEGTVIRPVEPKFLAGGSRVILKNKNERFSEKQKESSRAPKAMDPMDGPTLECFNKVSLFITENRLRNVLSHMGPVTKKDFGKIAAAFNKDIIEDFSKEYSDFGLLEKKEVKRINKEMGRLSTKLIREHFLNIIDGNF